MAYEIYSTRTAEDILYDMLDTVDDKLDKREGGIIYDMQAPAAIEVEALGFVLDGILENGWTNSAQGDYLTDRCSELGVDRKAGEFARGQVLFVADEGVEIEEGSLVYTPGEVAFSTDYAVEIPESGELLVDVTAEDIGISGNIMAGEITTVDPTVENIISVSNPKAFDGGVDEETDDALKERYYLRVRKPITSGNIYHYESLALEIKGVGAVKVIPLHAGPGTVKIIVASEQGGAVTAEVVEQVQAHIEAQQIIGVDALAVSVESVPIAINAEITLEAGYDLPSATQAIKEALKAYFIEATREGIVRYAQVGNALIDANGVLDYEALTINSDIRNIAITDEQSAEVGEVTIYASA